jgi:hypothetical protein
MGTKSAVVEFNCVAGKTAIGVKEGLMNQAVHQLLRLVLEGFTWFLKTIETLWDWSWTQIMSAFNMSWANLPPWKLVVGVIAIVILAALLFVMFRRALAAFGEIAAAFWTMAMTVFGVLFFVVIAGLFSRGFQWVVASVPDHFWEKFL